MTSDPSLPTARSDQCSLTTEQCSLTTEQCLLNIAATTDQWLSLVKIFCSWINDHWSLIITHSWFPINRCLLLDREWHCSMVAEHCASLTFHWSLLTDHGSPLHDQWLILTRIIDHCLLIVGHQSPVSACWPNAYWLLLIARFYRSLTAARQCPLTIMECIFTVAQTIDGCLVIAQKLLLIDQWSQPANHHSFSVSHRYLPAMLVDLCLGDWSMLHHCSRAFVHWSVFTARWSIPSH